MKSCLEQLLDLRPADDMPATIFSAVTALKEKRAAFEAEAKALRDKLKTSMLFAPVAEVKAAEARVTELERADAQALDLIGGFTAKYHERAREEDERALHERRQVLETAEAEFAARFAAAYPGLVEIFVPLAKEYAMLTVQHDRLNADLRRYNSSMVQRKCAPAPALPELQKPLEDVYFDRTCLPAAGLTEENRTHTPMAHQGPFWQAARAEGAPPGFLKQLQHQDEERRRRDALDASRREAELAAQPKYSNIGSVRVI